MKLLSTSLIVLLILSSCVKKPAKTIDLSGKWNYQLDSLNIGEKEHWYKNQLSGIIQLPGALRDYKIGNEPTLTTKWTGSIYDSSWYFNPKMEKYRQPGNLKFPFWLTPDKHYVGSVWFQKQIEIPENWKGKNLSLVLERPHWQTKVWMDTIYIGNDNSLSVPHLFSIPSNKIKPGKHTLTVLVDNAIHDMDPGINSHSISDHTQGNWNGIIGKMQLIEENHASIELVKLTPKIVSKTVHLRAHIRNLNQLSEPTLSIKVKDLSDNRELDVTEIKVTPTDSSVIADFSMGDDLKLWSEFSPNLYEMTLTLKDGNQLLDEKNEVFGMREFTINDKQFEINGTPTFLRGTTECSVFPLTGYPPTDENEWARIFKICQSFGLNHMRFHSYCPPEAAFIAADKAGIYLQVEGPSWAKYSTSLGYGRPIDDYLMVETKRIIDTYGNHPSFCMMAYGNEPSGRYVGYLENWVDHFRNYDPQRLFTGASTGGSWHIIDNSDFIVRAPPRGLAWKNKQPESGFDYRNKTENQQRPYITFEMGQWCVFPNFKEIDKYTGSLKAKNFELFQEDLNDHHMGDQAHDFLMASGKLQASCYKQEIEATLRTPNLAGFQLLSLNDFSGQGTALVGVLDAFWDEKGYISANEFKQFCNTVVPLARLPKFTLQNTDTLYADIEIANFSGSVIENRDIKWQLSNSSGIIVEEGVLKQPKIAIGNNNPVGNLNASLKSIKTADKLNLAVTIGEYSNNWNIWVYPNTASPVIPEEITIAKSLDKNTVEILNKGGKVLLLSSDNIENGKDVIQHLTPAFWNTSWFRMRPPHTTGILIKNKHPLFNHFPTDYYSDHQWWEIANKQPIMKLENFPNDFRPIVQPIDTWFLNRRLAMIFEAKVGKGQLIVCSIDLSNNLEKRPVAKQLMNSMIAYMQTAEFSPKKEVSIDIIQELFEKKEREGWNSYVNQNP